MARSLEHERYNRALYANATATAFQETQFDLQLFLEEQYLTQSALDTIAATISTCPENLAGIDEIHILYDRLQDIPDKFAIDIAGMPNAGKSTAVNRWIAADNNNLVLFMDEINIPGLRELKVTQPDLYNAILREYRLRQLQEWDDNYVAPTPPPTYHAWYY